MFGISWSLQKIVCELFNSNAMLTDTGPLLIPVLGGKMVGNNIFARSGPGWMNGYTEERDSSYWRVNETGHVSSGIHDLEGDNSGRSLRNRVLASAQTSQINIYAGRPMQGSVITVRVPPEQGRNQDPRVRLHALPPPGGERRR
jgi:hypothetical protein